MANPQNVTIQVNPENGILTLALDCGKRLGPSASGKTIMVGSTHGAVPVQAPDGTMVYISVNAYVYPPKGERR